MDARHETDRFEPARPAADAKNEGLMAAAASRRGRWVALCDALLLALTTNSHASIETAQTPLERLDALKDAVSVAHRLFALERALAETPELASDAPAAPLLPAFADRLAEWITRPPDELGTPGSSATGLEASPVRLEAVGSPPDDE